MKRINESAIQANVFYFNNSVFHMKIYSIHCNTPNHQGCHCVVAIQSNFLLAPGSGMIVDR